MRPGSVTTVAQLNGKLLFGLSGNPSACYVGFELFVRPCIRAYMFSENHMQKEKSIIRRRFSETKSIYEICMSKTDI